MNDFPTRPCLGCGYCCREARCLLGISTYGFGAGRTCPALHREGGIWRCALANVYHYELAIGEGCCSPLNSDRQRLAAAEREAR
jgi:hypothetical protein